mgnify:CR=1 FL=1
MNNWKTYIKQLVKSAIPDDTKKHSPIAPHVTLILTGGGHMIPYTLGALCYLQEYIRASSATIETVHCVSAGAICGAMVLTNNLLEQLVSCKEALLSPSAVSSMNISKFLSPFMDDSSYVSCQNKLHIYANELQWNGPRRIHMSRYESTEELLHMVHGSSCVPGIIAPVPYHMHNNRKLVDGMYQPVVLTPSNDNVAIEINVRKKSLYPPDWMQSNPAMFDSHVMSGILDAHMACKMRREQGGVRFIHNTMYEKVTSAVQEIIWKYMIYCVMISYCVFLSLWESYVVPLFTSTLVRDNVKKLISYFPSYTMQSSYARAMYGAFIQYYFDQTSKEPEES